LLVARGEPIIPGLRGAFKESRLAEEVREPQKGCQVFLYGASYREEQTSHQLTETLK
jgi:hypothetical protein